MTCGDGYSKLSRMKNMKKGKIKYPVTFPLNLYATICSRPKNFATPPASQSHAEGKRLLPPFFCIPRFPIKDSWRQIYSSSGLRINFRCISKRLSPETSFPSGKQCNINFVQVLVKLDRLDYSIVVLVYLGEPARSAVAAAGATAVAVNVARGLLHADAHVAVEIDVREVDRSLKYILEKVGLL